MDYDQLATDLTESEALKQQNILLRKRILELKAQVGLEQQIVSLITDTLQGCALPNPALYRVPAPAMSLAPLEGLFCLSDPHVGERVSKTETEGFGEYNFDIYQQRLWHCRQKILELTKIQRLGSAVDRLVILMLGDIVTGDIHAELDDTADLSLPTAICAAGWTLGHFVVGLAPHFKQVDVIGVVGNHGRKDLKPRFKNRRNRNWDYAAYQIAAMLSAKCTGVHWHLPNSPAVIVGIAGANLLVKHGDGVDTRGVLPFYGMYRDSEREYRKRRKADPAHQFDYIIQGHLHEFTVLKERIVVPSMIGANEFSMNKLHAVSDPAQLLMYSTAKHPLCSMHMINLKDVKPRHGFPAFPFAE